MRASRCCLHQAFGTAAARRSSVRCRVLLLVLLLSTPAAAEQPPEASVGLCEQTVYADARAAVQMADSLLAPLDPVQDRGPYHEALGCKAWALAMLGQPEQAIELAEAMAAAAARIEPADARVRVLRRAASVYQTLDRFEPAVQLLGEAMRLAEREGLQGLGIEVMTNLAVLHSSANQFEPAIAHLERALALAIDTEDRRREVPVRFNLGQTYRSAKHYQEAADTLEPLVPALEAPGLESRLASLLASLGWLKTELGDVDAAERYFSRAAALLESLDNDAELIVVLTGQSKLLVQRGEHELAGELAQRALDIAHVSGDYTSITSAMTAVIQALESQGRHAEAMAMLREKGELTTEHIRSQQRSRLNELEVQLGLERQERELDQLRQERERQSLALQVQRRNLLLALGAVGIGLLALAWQRRVNRRLHHMSRSDQLTGLLNRRGLAELMEKPRHESNGCWFVLLIDIDHFKAINDRYGHGTGDRVLMALGSAMAGFAQGHRAHAARWGGEEFAVLASADTADAACRLAAEMGRLAAGIETPTDQGTTVSATVSLGFAPLFASEGARPGWQSTLRLADELLYRAKREGRSRGLGIWPRQAGAPTPPNGDLDELLASRQWQLQIAYGPTGSGD